MKVATPLGNISGQVQALIDGYKKLYPYNFRWHWRDNELDLQFIVSTTIPSGAGMDELFAAKFSVEQETLVKLAPHDSLLEIAKGIGQACEKVTRGLGESNTGKYPFIRLWAERHLSGVPKLFMYPERDIPHWVYNKFRGQNEYPNDSGKKPTPKPGPPRAPKPLELVPIIDTDIEKPFRKSEVEEIMATTTKKKRTITKPKKMIDPSKIKKPLCPIHETQMKHDPLEGKWKCTEEDCKIVSRPKRAADDRALLLGKGGLQLRLIVQGADMQVILISDDNVALNITPLVNITDICRDFDAVNQAQVASENGRDYFTINVEKDVVFSGLKLTVMGADDLSIVEA